MCALTDAELLKLKPGDVVWGVLKIGIASSYATLEKLTVRRSFLSATDLIYIEGHNATTDLTLLGSARNYYTNYWEARRTQRTLQDVGSAMPELTIDEVLHLKPGTVVFVVSRSRTRHEPGVIKVVVGRAVSSYGGHCLCFLQRETPSCI